MPFALVIIGLLMIVTGARDTYKDFGAQVTQDFTGEGNFLYWIAALGAVGAVGYAPEFRTFSRVFMALIIVALILKNGGFFDKFSQALNTAPVADTAVNGGTSIAAPAANNGYNMGDILQDKMAPAPTFGDISNFFKYLIQGQQ